jgi:protein-S-isoprenylcysteine O-methyltransferase Ste14
MRFLYWLVGMVALWFVGAVIGGVWDHSDTAGNIAVTLWAVSIVGAALLLIAWAWRTMRRRSLAQRAP